MDLQLEETALEIEIESSSSKIVFSVSEYFRPHSWSVLGERNVSFGVSSVPSNKLISEERYRTPSENAWKWRNVSEALLSL